MENNRFNHPFSELVKNYLQFEYEHNREDGPRAFNRASDVGKDHYSLYHKRMGTPITNPPTAEGLGKMMAGNVYHKFLQDKLEQMGILQCIERRIEIPELNVVGHYDARVGGAIKWGDAIIDTERLKIPEFMKNLRFEWLRQMKEQFGHEIPEYLIDIKSVSLFMFERMNSIGWKPVREHAMQLTQYWMGEGRPDIPLLLFYVCKDDFRMQVVQVNPAEWEEAVVTFWGGLEAAVKLNAEPAPELPIILDEQGFMSENWHVVWSNYMSMIMARPDVRMKLGEMGVNQAEKIETKEQLREIISPIIRAHNRRREEELEMARLRDKYKKAGASAIKLIIEQEKAKNANYNRTKAGQYMKKILEEKNAL